MKIRKPEFQEQEMTPRNKPIGLHENRAALAEAQQAMNSVSQGLSYVGQAVGDIFLEKKKISDSTKVSDALINAEKDHLVWRNEFLQSNPDPDTVAEKIQGNYDKTVSKYKAELPGGEAQASFTLRANNRKMEVAHYSFGLANQLWLSKQRGDTITQMSQLDELGIVADTQEGAAQYKRASEDIMFSKMGNVFSNEEAAKILESHSRTFDARRQDFVVAGIENDIADDPHTADLQLRSEFGYKELKDSKVRERLKRAASQAVILKQENDRVIEQRAKKDLHDKQELELSDLFFQGKLTVKEIVNRRGISGDEMYVWGQRLESRLKSSDAQTDLKTYMRIKEQIVSGTPLETIKGNIIASQGQLSEHHRFNLYNEAVQELDINQQEGRKKGYEVIKNLTIGRETQLEKLMEMGETSAGQAEKLQNYFKATAMLDNEIQKARKDRKPLTPEQIVERAFILVGTVKRTGPSATLGVVGVPTKPATPKKAGETPDEYFKRTTGEGIPK